MDKRKKFKGEIKEAYVLLEHVDSSLSYANIMLNSTLLDELEKNFSLLLNSRKKPYFARMDMHQAGHPHTESLYIGKGSLFDESMEMPLVVDWRAPIAGVYYDGRLGRTSYLSSGTEFEIDLHKKRQYTIEKGLEFDAVVVTAIHDRFEFEELDAKLLYVAMTRALHRLSVHFIENAIPYFNRG